MLELYHHGSSVCAAKVRFCMGEKGIVPDEMHYIDILSGEQFNPEYLAINPKAVVPTLVHDGAVVAESTLICEYLDEVFDGPNSHARRPARKSSYEDLDEGGRRATAPSMWRADLRVLPQAHRFTIE